MNKLSFNKTVVFRSNLEGNNTLVRSGSSNDINQNEINSFICCLLHGTMKKYKNSSESERNESLQKILDEMKMKLPKLDYYKTKIDDYINSLFKKIQEFYIYVNEENHEHFEFKAILESNENNLELYQIISEIITINDFQKVFKFSEEKFYKSNDFTSSNFLKILQKEVVRMIMYKDFFDDIEKSKQDFLINSTLNLLSKLNSININNSIIIDFTQLDKEKVNFLSQLFDVNIIFINSETRKPFFIDNNYTFDEKKNSIILLSFDLKYFEIIGKLLNEDKINRCFLSFEEMIKNIVYLIDLNRKKDVHDTKENTLEHDTKDDNIEHDTKDDNIEHDTKDDNIEHDTKENTLEHDTKDDTNEHDTKENTLEHDTKENTNEHDTKENTNEHEEIKDNFENGPIINEDSDKKIHYNSDDELLNALEEDT